MVRTKQGGSILSFVVLGVVMALLLVGGAYVVRHYLAPAEKSSPVATIDDGADVSRQDSNGSSADQKSAESEKDSQSEKSGPDQGKTQESTNANADKTGEGSSETKTEQPAAPGTNGTQSSGGLPSTGPSDMLAAGFMLSSSVAVVIAYMRSRRLPASL